MKRSFKIGDKIKVKVGESPYYSVGDIGVIYRIDSDGDLWVNFVDQGNETVFPDGNWYIDRKNVEYTRPVSISQVKQILEYLEDGNPITPLIADEVFGCKRLTSRIYDLKKLGYKINRELKTTVTGQRYASYRLAA